MEHFGSYIEGNSVLDVGAGVGLLTELLCSLSKEVFACDLSLDSLKETPAALRRAFICNMENLPLRNRSVDWIASNFALHWSDWQKSLEEFFRVSKRGFLFSVPVKGSLEGIGFPFPPLEEILELVKPTRWFVKNLPIPFEGREFLLFFKYTGTGFNPNKTLSAFEILKDPSKVKSKGFKTLFLLKVL